MTMTHDCSGPGCLLCAFDASRAQYAELRGDPCAPAAYQWPELRPDWTDDSQAEIKAEDRAYEWGQRLARYNERNSA